MYRKNPPFLIGLVLSMALSGISVGHARSFEFRFPQGVVVCDPAAPSPTTDGRPLTSDEVAKATPCMIPITKVYLTQMSVGKAVAQCKRVDVQEAVDDTLKGFSTKRKDKIQALNSYLWDETKPQRKVPLIIGLDGRFYLTDHHHMSWAVWDYADSEGIGDKEKRGIILQGVVTANWRDKAAVSLPHFWNAMAAAGKAWFYDENGDPMPSSVREKKRGGFPDSFGAMKDDPFRSVSRWAREACLYLKKGEEQCSGSNFAASDNKVNQQLSDYMEFRWGNYLRSVSDSRPIDDQPSARDLDNPAKLTKIYKKLVPAMFKGGAVDAYFDAQPGWGSAQSYGQNTSVKGSYWKLSFEDETADGDALKCENAPDLRFNK